MANTSQCFDSTFKKFRESKKNVTQSIYNCCEKIEEVLNSCLKDIDLKIFHASIISIMKELKREKDSRLNLSNHLKPIEVSNESQASNTSKICRQSVYNYRTIDFTCFDQCGSLKKTSFLKLDSYKFVVNEEGLISVKTDKALPSSLITSNFTNLNDDLELFYLLDQMLLQNSFTTSKNNSLHNNYFDKNLESYSCNQTLIDNSYETLIDNSYNIKTNDTTPLKISFTSRSNDTDNTMDCSSINIQTEDNFIERNDEKNFDSNIAKKCSREDNLQVLNDKNYDDANDHLLDQYSSLRINNIEENPCSKKIAIYDFASTEKEFLNLITNEEVYLLEEFQDGWCRISKNGKTGFVPRSYIS